MAIVFDAFAETAASTAPTAITLAVGSITNGIILVATGSEDFGSSGDITSVSASGLTFTQQIEHLYNPAGTTQAVCLWSAPSGSTSGNVDITVSYGSGVDSGTLFACSFSGVDQTTPMDTAATTNTITSGTSFSCDITTATDNAMLVDIVDHNDGSAVMTKHADQTEIAQLNQSTSQVAGMSYKAAGTAGAKTMSWTADASASRFVYGVVALRPVAASSSVKTINGLAVASVKTVNGLAIASVKTVNGLA